MTSTALPLAPEASALDRDFAAVGITLIEERAYRVLLKAPASTSMHVSELLGVAEVKVRKALKSLETKGLATSSLNRPRRFFPVAPDLALEALVKKRADELARVRVAAATLREQTRPEADRPAVNEQVMEILENREQVLCAIAQIQRMARHDCLCLDKPPYVSGPPNTVDAAEIEGLTRGIRYRTLIDVEAFKLPGVLDRLRASIDAGASVRTASRLPLKLLVADGSIGLIPMNLKELTGPVLLLRSSSLLDTLRAHFELLWDQATPITFSRSGELKRVDSTAKFPLDIDQLVPRLAAGVNDKTIAHDLGLSPRTFDRRIDEFMKNLNARTRFQAGWLAAHKLAVRA